MAEAILSIVAEGVLNKVLALAAEELSLLWGFEDDLERLAETLEIIQDLLLDAEGKRISLRSVQRWLKKLSSVASDADNVLDEFAFEVLRQKILGPQKSKLFKVRDFFSFSNPLLFRHMIAGKIKEVNSMLDVLYKRANDIGLRPVEVLHTSAQIIEIRTSHPFADKSKVVGRDEDIDKVLDMLFSSKSEEEPEVVSIVGMPGQGKTTLAQIVFNHESVINLFDDRLWICVSNDFDVNRLLEEMMQCLHLAHSHELSNRGAIIDAIKEKLRGKKYLLVLDDVWNEKTDEWETMRNCLRDIGGSIGSKILVTTRSNAVVSTMQTSQFHSLDGLPDDHSWTLFREIAFAAGGPVEKEELLTIGKDMVKKCGGVPLAIKTLAHLMHTIKDENEWSMLEKSEKWGSLMTGDVVLSTLRLSYDHLPSLSLKQCFAYCSIFMKDTILEKEKLIQLWMAQGLLNPPEETHGVPVEYFVGNNYFKILVQNSLFQDLRMDELNSIQSCKMHDLVHDLALEISSGFCSTPLTRKANSIHIQAVHLTCDGRLISQIPDRVFSKLRTLYLMSGVLADLLARLKCLRVLILEDEAYYELPRCIGKLKHLRYLDISKTSIATLPNSITKLYYLQTLRLNFLNKLPPKFENLINLRYFYILNEHQNKLNCLLPRLGQFAYLQTIPYFVVCPEIGCGIKELGALRNLKGKLIILGLEHVGNEEEAKKADLSKKSSIDSLELCWNRRDPYAYSTNSDTEVSKDKNILDGLHPHSNLKILKMVNFEGTELSSWMLQCSSILQNLVMIELRNFNRCEQLPSLGHLPCLEIVGLYGFQKVRQITNEFYGLPNTDAADSTRTDITVFPALKELTLEDMSSLEKWLEAKHPSPLHTNLFAKLEKLRIVNCPNLTCLPDMQNLMQLKEFKITECSTLECLPVGLESFDSLQTLDIRNCHSLVAIPDIRNLHSLYKLILRDCKKLNALPSGIQVLKSLKELELGGFCEELDYFPWPEALSSPTLASEKNKQVQHYFTSLASLQMFGWEKLTQLPERLQNLTSLSSLQLQKFNGLVALPTWLVKIQTLQVLKLIECENLKHMQYLPNLKVLQILSCPFLVEKFGKGSSPEWDKIKRIPNYEVQGKTPQGNHRGYVSTRSTDPSKRVIKFRMGRLNSELGQTSLA